MQEETDGVDDESRRDSGESERGQYSNSDTASAAAVAVDSSSSSSKPDSADSSSAARDAAQQSLNSDTDQVSHVYDISAVVLLCSSLQLQYSYHLSWSL